MKDADQLRAWARAHARDQLRAILRQFPDLAAELSPNGSVPPAPRRGPGRPRKNAPPADAAPSAKSERISRHMLAWWAKQSPAKRRAQAKLMAKGRYGKAKGGR